MKKLANNVYVKIDNDCFALSEKKVSKEGKEYFSDIGYYSTAPQVSQKLCDMGLKEFQDKDWLQCVAFVTESHDNFKAWIDKLKVRRIKKEIVYD